MTKSERILDMLYKVIVTTAPNSQLLHIPTKPKMELDYTSFSSSSF